MLGRANSVDRTGNGTPTDRRPGHLLAVRFFVVALSLLLAGYMFMGRGFAHVGLAPVYVGEVVLAIGLLATAVAVVRLRPSLRPSPIVWLLLAFMALGFIRTVPYLGTYGVDALRDAVLWGYAAFALILYVLADRVWVTRAFQLYGRVVPVFAAWLPASWFLFLMLSAGISTSTPGAVIPLVYFKAGDMAVHAVGSIAFLVMGAGAIRTIQTFAWRYLIAQSLTWTIFICGTVSRGALVAAAAGLAVLALYVRRSRNWVPVFAASAILLVALVAPGLLGGAPQPSPSPSVAPSPSATPVASVGPSAVASPSSSVAPSPSVTPVASVGPSAVASPVPSQSPSPATPAPGREASLRGLWNNLVSIFTASSDANEEGTKTFRLAWWKKIVDYTFFGPYFWTGKGFGVNLADDDGFQATLDHSLRAPHNSHLSALARMGVPGFVLWIAFQGAFGIALLRSIIAYRRSGQASLAAAGAWILVYWVSMMIVTSFDPYLEGPQGGIWFWTLIGLGLVLMRQVPRQPES